jgi:hypothetical protein
MTDHKTGTRAEWLTAERGQWWRRHDEYGAR